MRFEKYCQYTSRWYTVRVKDDETVADMIRWCKSYQSPHAFHACSHNRLPYRKIEHPGEMLFRFEAKEDYIMYMMTWVLGENVATCIG